MKLKFLSQSDSGLVPLWNNYLSKCSEAYPAYYSNMKDMLSLLGSSLERLGGSFEPGIFVCSTSRDRLAAALPVVRTSKQILLVTEFFDSGACYPRLNKDVGAFMCLKLGFLLRSFSEEYPVQDVGLSTLTFLRADFEEGALNFMRSPKVQSYEGSWSCFRRFEEYLFYAETEYELIPNEVTTPRQHDWSFLSKEFILDNSPSGEHWAFTVRDSKDRTVYEFRAVLKKNQDKPIRVLFYSVEKFRHTKSPEILRLEYTYMLLLVCSEIIKQKKVYAFEVTGPLARLLDLSVLRFPSSSAYFGSRVSSKYLANQAQFARQNEAVFSENSP